MTKPYITNTVELLYVSLMRRWQAAAPPNRHFGLLDGVYTCNSQSERLAFALKKIALGQENRAYSTIESHCRRTDGESYVSKNSDWMQEPVALTDGWHLEGCQRITQKLAIAGSLRYLGGSARFIACVEAFIANDDIARFVPTPEQQDELLRELIAAGEIESEVVLT